MKVSIFINDSYINEDKTCMVYLRIFISGKYLKIPLDIYVNPENFDKKTFKVIRGSKKETYNHQISTALGAASDIILKYSVNKHTLTRQRFIKEFSNPATLTSFYHFMEDQIKMRTGKIEESSANQHMACLNKMKRFKKELLMSELDEILLHDFEKYLRNKLLNNQNTVFNNMKTLKTYVNRAVRMELIKTSPFKYYPLKKVESNPEFLSEDEKTKLEDLYNRNYLPPRYQNVLRWFLFSCQTGLRIGDLRRVKFENIISGILVFKPEKTENLNGKSIHIPLTILAKKLIKDENPNRIKGPIFNLISDQRMNKHIKDIVEVVGINRSISFHAARHTFATSFLRKCKQANGIIILQKLLGHASIQTTMVYSHVLGDDIKEAMDLFQK